MKTLINVPDRVWGKMRDYATVERLSLNSAVESLLRNALSELGYDTDIQRKQRI
jgi:hypothetical protein